MGSLVIAVIEAALVAPAMTGPSTPLDLAASGAAALHPAVDLTAVVPSTHAEPSATTGARRTPMIIQASPTNAE